MIRSENLLLSSLSLSSQKVTLTISTIPGLYYGLQDLVYNPLPALASLFSHTLPLVHSDLVTLSFRHAKAPPTSRYLHLLVLFPLTGLHPPHILVLYFLTVNYLFVFSYFSTKRGSSYAIDWSLPDHCLFFQLSLFLHKTYS